MIESIKQFLNANKTELESLLPILLVYKDKIHSVSATPIAREFLKLFKNQLIIVNDRIVKYPSLVLSDDSGCINPKYKLSDYIQTSLIVHADDSSFVAAVSDFKADSDKFQEWIDVLKEFDISCSLETKQMHGLSTLIENLSNLQFVDEHFEQYQEYIDSQMEMKEMEESDYTRLREKLEIEYNRLNKTTDLSWNPYNMYEDILLIEHHFQEPWGVMHMDAPYSYKKYPTIAHYIYAQILQEDSIDLNCHPKQFKQLCEKSYRNRLEKIQFKALKTAYSHLVEKDDAFRRFLNETGELQCEFKSPLFDMTIQVLNGLKTDFSNSSIELFSPADYISPNYKRIFTIAERTFSSILEYIYYCYFEFFGKLDYDKNHFEQQFAQYQEEYFNRVVLESAKTAYEDKLRNDIYFKRILRSSPKFNVLENGFLAKYTNFYCNQVLDTLKSGLSEFEVNVIDVSCALEDPILKDWVRKNRLPDLIENINAICAYLKTDIDPILLNAILDRFYYAICECDDVIVYHPPLSFVNMIYAIPSIQNLTGHKTIYLIWYYISILFHSAQKNSINIIENMNQVPFKFTKEQIYLAYRTVLYSIRSLCMDKYKRFTIGVDELRLTNQLFKIDLEIDKNFRKIDSELYQRIRTDMKSFSLPNNKFTDICVSIYIYVESIYTMMDSLSLKTKSRFYYYS